MASFLVLGILGGIGSGKSTVARVFGDLGAEVIDADQLARGCLERADVQERLRGAFGVDVVAAGQVRRDLLAQRVFPDPERVATLNRIVHPCVLEVIEARLAELRRAPAGPELVVLDVPLLLESGLDRRCDRLLFVEASRAARLERVRATRGWTEEELDQREKNQKPVDEKEARAHYKVANEGPLDDRTREQIRAVHRQLLSERPVPSPPDRSHS